MIFNRWKKKAILLAWYGKILEQELEDKGYFVEPKSELVEEITSKFAKGLNKEKDVGR